MPRSEDRQVRGGGPRMQDSHTPVPADETTDPDRLRLVGTATLGLAERLAGRLDRGWSGGDGRADGGRGHRPRGAEGQARPGQGRQAPRQRAGHGDPRGRRVPVRRPRARTVGDDEHELSLESYEAFTSADLLAGGVVARMLGGLSTRGYPVGLEPVGAQVEQAATGTSRSAVSRRFVTATAERLDQLLGRPLGGQRWLVVFLDGFGMGEHLLVGALGVTADGTKVPLGVVEGTTENKAVCTRLVTGLRDRGLDAECGVLFVLDGGKALGAAVRGVFGAKALVQRCRRHKERINRPSGLYQASGTGLSCCCRRRMWLSMLAMTRAWRATSVSQPRAWASSRSVLTSASWAWSWGRNLVVVTKLSHCSHAFTNGTQTVIA